MPNDVKTRLIQKTGFTVFVYFILAVLANISSLLNPGFFGPDLLTLWRAMGGAGLSSSITVNPLGAVFFRFIASLAGFSPLGWQVSSLVFQWAAAVLFWLLLCSLWPKRRQNCFWSAALFQVFPAFGGIPLAVTNSQIYFCLAVFFLSILWMSTALKREKRDFRFWLIFLVSVAGSIVLAGSSDLIGLEFLRPVVIWICLGPGMRPYLRIGKTLAVWLVYLALPVLAGVLIPGVYRFSLWQTLSTTGESGNQLVRRIMSTLADALFLAWRQTVRLPEDKNFIWIFLVALALVFGLLWLWLWGLERTTGPKSGTAGLVEKSNPAPLVLGVFLLLAGGIGINWAAQPAGPASNSGFLIAPLLPGAALLTAGLVELLFLDRYRSLIAALLISLGLGFQMQNGHSFSLEWDSLKSFWSQMKTRVPRLEKGSILISEELPFHEYDDTSLTIITNLVYAGKIGPGELDYRFLTSPLQLGPAYPVMVEKQNVTSPVEEFQFTSDTQHILALVFNPPSCLRLMSGDDLWYPNIPSNLRQTLPFSNRRLVQDQDQEVSVPFLSAPPQNEWCANFQQADLAAQREKWADAAAIGEKAANAGLAPKNQVEYFSLIEANLRMQKWKAARKLSLDVSSNESLRPALCRLWKMAAPTPDGGGQIPVDAAPAMKDIGCTPS